MSEEVDLRLMRLLTGESPPGEAESTRRLLAADAVTARRFAELERVWEGLDLAPPDPADEGLLLAVRQRLAERSGEAAGGLWGLPLALGRAAAAVILAAGIGLGVWLEGTLNPFIVDDSLAYFLRHLGDVNTIHMVLIALSGACAYWFGQGRERFVPRPPIQSDEVVNENT